MSSRPSLVRPPVVQPGDTVAILSPSWAGPGVFPHVQDLGLQRLRADLHLEPVEYPTTRKVGATPQERAADIHAAFADPEIKAIMSSIGGDDQIKVLRYLDPAVLRANPKAFFGYSDNTNLLLYLWNLGMI
ncbi:MAG: LD-carboxypeptidase, partial [Actinobacteria bacterium]|nr:LD-carboxypeptidase [Actinomycetota bacterium]